MRYIIAVVPLLVSCTIKLDASNAITGQTYKANISIAPITSSTKETLNSDGSYTRSRDISYYTVPVV